MQDGHDFPNLESGSWTLTLSRKHAIRAAVGLGAIILLIWAVSSFGSSDGSGAIERVLAEDKAAYVRCERAMQNSTRPSEALRASLPTCELSTQVHVHQNSGRPTYTTATRGREWSSSWRASPRA